MDSNKMTLVLWIVVSNTLAMASSSMSVGYAVLVSLVFWVSFFYWFDKSYKHLENADNKEE